MISSGKLSVGFIPGPQSPELEGPREVTCTGAALSHFPGASVCLGGPRLASCVLDRREKTLGGGSSWWSGTWTQKLLCTWRDSSFLKPFLMHKVSFGKKEDWLFPLLLNEGIYFYYGKLKIQKNRKLPVILL